MVQKIQPIVHNLIYKNKHYQYGVFRKRDFPVRGTPLFFIKVRTGVGLFVIYEIWKARKRKYRQASRGDSETMESSFISLSDLNAERPSDLQVEY